VKKRSFVGALVSFLVITSIARGDGEKIVHLKNGRSIQGEIVQDDASSYVLKTAGGTTKIAKDAVASVEDVPPPGNDPFAPTPGQTAPRPDGTAPVATVTPTKPAPPIVPTPDVTTAKKLLLEVPSDDGTEAGKLARARALQAVRERIALKTLVAIVAEPVGKTAPTNDRTLALSLVCAEPAAKARPLLLSALSAFTVADFKIGPRTDLFTALANYPGDKDGELTKTLFAKVDELRTQGILLDDFARPMAETRAHDRLAQLHQWLLSPTTKPESVPGVAKICQAVQSTLDEPDVPLLELVKKLGDVKDLYRFRYACTVLRDSDGKVAAPLMRLLRPIERHADAQLTVPQDAIDCLTEAYLTLALLPCPNVPPDMTSAAEGYGYLLTTLDMLRSHELRGGVLAALMRIRTTNEFPTKSFLDRLLSIMESGHLDDSEVSTGVAVLKHLMGRDHGADLAAWRKDIDSLER